MPDAPAGDALEWARQWCDDIMLRYQNATNPGPLHAWLATPLAMLVAEERAAARAEGAAEEREAIRKLCDCHVAIANGCPCVESLDAAIRARSPSSGTEAQP